MEKEEKYTFLPERQAQREREIWMFQNTKELIIQRVYPLLDTFVISPTGMFLYLEIPPVTLVVPGVNFLLTHRDHKL